MGFLEGLMIWLGILTILIIIYYLKHAKEFIFLIGKIYIFLATIFATIAAWVQYKKGAIELVAPMILSIGFICAGLYFLSKTEPKCIQGMPVHTRTTKHSSELHEKENK